MGFSLYQVKNGPDYRDFRFTDYSLYVEFNGNSEVNLLRYDKVYSGEIEDYYDVNQGLEELYRIFNVEHPEDFYGRSMSVSDVIEINGFYYYCDSFGFKEVNVTY